MKPPKKHYFRGVRKMRHLLALLVLLFVNSRPLYAQDYDVFDSYGINEGLPQSSVWHITQDKNGFMWFSTADGVCRFDGYDFTVYRHDPADSNSLLNSTNCHFYIDSEGDLWTTSIRGICLYNYETDKFNVIYRDDTKQTFYYYANCFFGEYKGYLWASMPLQGLLKIDKKKRKVEVVKHSGAYDHKIAMPKAEQKGMFSSGVINNGKIWLSIAPDKCVVYDIDRNKLDRPELPYIHALSNFNDSEVVTSTRNGSLLLINKNTYSFREIPLGMDVMSTQILVQDSQLIIACATGLMYVDTRNWNVEKVVRSFSKDKNITFGNARCLYKDRSGNLWIGTDGDGVKKLRAPNKKFRYYSSFSVSKLVKAIYATSDRLYVGYFKNDLDIFDRKKGFIENRTMTVDAFNFHNIYAMTSVDSNTLLLGKLDPNIAYTYSLRSAKLTSLYPPIRKILHKEEVPYSEPFFYKKGDLIYTNVGNNVVALNVLPHGEVRPYLFYSFENEVPTNVFIDSKGTCWIGTKNALHYLENGKAKIVVLPEMIQVKTINEDAKGNIWAGTLEGIYIIGADKKLKLKYNERNGLSNGFIYGILRDGDDMWFSHNKGLTVYNTTTEKFKHYTKEDGLQSNEFNTGAYFKAEDGTLFFGGVYGTNGFKPEEIKDNPHVPRVVITNVKLFDKDLKTDVAYWNLREIELSYTQNSLTFEFAGLEFTNSEQNQYAYIMEGLDEKWIYCGKTRFARYPALPPGTYYFKVKASNNDGIWQETPTVIKIVIVPPFWQTWWFRALCVLLLIIVITVILNSIQKQRNRAHLRAIELQQKIQMERERISRDLHDNVGTQLSLISNNIEWVEHPLKALSEKEKLEKLHYVNTMARDIIATLRETIWALNKEQISLEEFSDKLKAFVHKQITIYPQIGLKFFERFAGELTLGPSEALNLFRICQEAIANALKYSGAEELVIDIENKGEKYKVTIVDNGKGFDVGSVDPSVQNGLENMKYRSADIGCELEINSTLTKGTSIVITKK